MYKLSRSRRILIILPHGVFGLFFTHQIPRAQQLSSWPVPTIPHHRCMRTKSMPPCDTSRSKIYRVQHFSIHIFRKRIEWVNQSWLVSDARSLNRKRNISIWTSSKPIPKKYILSFLAKNIFIGYKIHDHETSKEYTESSELCIRFHYLPLLTKFCSF